MVPQASCVFCKNKVKVSFYPDEVALFFLLELIFSSTFSVYKSPVRIVYEKGLQNKTNGKFLE